MYSNILRGRALLLLAAWTSGCAYTSYTADQRGRELMARFDAEAATKKAAWDVGAPERERKRQEGDAAATQAYQNSARMIAELEVTMETKAIKAGEGAAAAWQQCLTNSSFLLGSKTADPIDSVIRSAFVTCGPQEQRARAQWGAGGGAKAANAINATMRRNLAAAMTVALMKLRDKPPAPLPPEQKATVVPLPEELRKIAR